MPLWFSQSRTARNQIPNDQGVLAEEGGSLDFLLFSPEDIAIFEEAQAAKVLNGQISAELKVAPRHEICPKFYTAGFSG